MVGGSCLCGAVRYEVDRFDTGFGHCHCDACRKAHAAPYATTARVLRDAFRIVTGADCMTGYESSPGKVRRFCRVCGSHVVAERADQPHVILRVATLDDDPGVTPAVHIWTAHDKPWLVDGADVPRHREWPPGR